MSSILASETPASVACTQSLERGLYFLLDHQDADGAWRDFLCPPGRSDAWTTAYIALRILAIVRDRHAASISALISMRAGHAVDRAAAFLQTSNQHSGWGYGSNCDIDCDTTSQAILLLQKLGLSISLRSYATIAGFQLPDGSFATYKNATHYRGWATGHPDVTAVALQALAPILATEHNLLERGVASLRRHVATPEGHLSFWWPSRFYLSRELLQLRKLLPAAPTLSLPFTAIPPNCFDVALALECSVLSAAADVSPYAEQLLCSQFEDGSWPTQPILRISSPDALTVVQANTFAAPLVIDDRRLFTTATVIQALSMWRHTI